VVINLNQATMTSSWSANFASSGDTLTVTPLSWNATIPVNGSVGFGYCANGTGRPVIVSATLTGGGATGTGGTGAGTGGTAASTGGTAPAASGGTAPAASGGTATGGVATGGQATGGTPAATGGTPAATGGASTGPAICRTVTTLPTQASLCTGTGGSYDGDSVCDANGNRCVCARNIWYCNNTCATAYPNPPTTNGDCTKGTACNYPATGAGCACVNSKWMCIGGTGCPASLPMTGQTCNDSTGAACDYPNSTASLHMVCACTPNADAGSGSTWTCYQSALCPDTQPPFPTGNCSGAAVCTYGTTHCACMQAGSTWVCI
jgi:hypothetical protein